MSGDTEIDMERFRAVATEMLSLGELLHCGSEAADVRDVGYRMKQLAVHLFGMFPQDHTFAPAKVQRSQHPVDRLLQHQTREQEHDCDDFLLRLPRSEPPL